MFDAYQGRASAAARPPPPSTPRPGADGIALNARVQLDGCRRRGVALSRARDAGGSGVDADDAGEPGPQRLGADRRVVRQRHRDAGSRAHRRARSARLRRGDPRQRQRPGDRRYQVAADRRAGAVGRRACRSIRRKFRSASGTAGFGSARPRWRPTVRAPSFRAATIFPPTRPTFASSLISTAVGRGQPVRKSSCSRSGRPMRSTARVDVAALSSWLAVRAIDRETRRLDFDRARRAVRRVAGVGLATGAATAVHARAKTRGQLATFTGHAAAHRCACVEPAGCAAAATDRGVDPRQGLRGRRSCGPRGR